MSQDSLRLISLRYSTDAHYDIASHDRGGEPSIDALARASATRSSSPVKDLDHCSPSPEDVSFRHGKLSFEEVLQLGGARPASRMSEIAIAVDQYFGGSSEYSEHRPDTQDPVVKAEPNMALNTRAEQHGLKAPNFWGQRELLPEPVPPRRHISDASVHLHNMRISQHLRSFSGLSDDSLLAELSARDQQNVLSHDQRSSSGFGSDGVPRSWGKVLQHPIGRGGLADEDMPTSQFSPRSGQGPKQVASSLIDGHFDGSHPSHVDGPFDQQVEESDRTSSLIPPTSASVQTFGSNYDETTAVWEKALTKHQEERLSPRKRGSSFSNLSRRPSRKGRESSDAQRNSSGETGNVQLPPPDVGLTPFGLKRVNTSLSFDRLSMPSKMFVSQPNSPSVDVDASRRVSNLLSVQDRQRLINSPPANDANTTSELGHQQLLVPGRHESGLTVPEITLSEPIGELPSSSADSYTGPFDHLPLSERPWARYSSEDRELRNGPASELTGDDVKVRDFQPAVEKIESPGSSPTKFDRLRRKEKIKLRAKTVVLKRMLLTDIPTAFKSSNGTFRRREHGHRSSVSTGGNLEYPELELLPSTAPRPATLADDRQFIKTDRRMSTDIPRKTAHHRQTSQQTSSKRFSSPVSSQYGSMTTRSPLQSDSGSQRRTSSFLESTYQKHISDQYRKRSSESISPLDGPDEDVQEAGKHSPGAKSLPARSLAAPVESTGGLIKSQSHQELRRSTQDLNKLLEENWRASLAKALQSAEGPWE